MNGIDSQSAWSRRGSLPTTRRTLFQRACDKSSPQVARKAFEELIALYLGPISAYIETSQRLNREVADECAQEFITTQMIEKDMLAGIRGGFRKYLKGALFNFMNAWRRDENRRVQKEESRAAAVREAEERFDLEYIRECLNRALANLEANSVDHAKILQRLYVDESPPSYQDLAKEWGMKVSDIRNMGAKAKKLLASALHQVLVDILGGEKEADIEIRTLFSVVVPWLRRI